MESDLETGGWSKYSIDETNHIIDIGFALSSILLPFISNQADGCCCSPREVEKAKRNRRKNQKSLKQNIIPHVTSIFLFWANLACLVVSILVFAFLLLGLYLQRYRLVLAGTGSFFWFYIPICPKGASPSKPCCPASSPTGAAKRQNAVANSAVPTRSLFSPMLRTIRIGGSIRSSLRRR